MRRLEGNDRQQLRQFFDRAAVVATRATCLRAKCGTVIVKNGQIIAEGFNGPALGLESNRTCKTQWNLSKKPKYDKTCCIHAEWRAIVNALRDNAEKIKGSTLYFMRIDEKGNFTDAGDPYCTVCSRLTLESGVSEFALWNDEGVDLYPTDEYDRLSFAYHSVQK